MTEGISNVEKEAYRFGTRNKQHRAPQVVVKKKSIKKPVHGKLVDSFIKWLFVNGVYCWPNCTGAYTTEYTRKDGTTCGIHTGPEAFAASSCSHPRRAS